jgi:hypothetical protein
VRGVFNAMPEPFPDDGRLVVEAEINWDD